ncbi:MAG TPA: acyl-CoA dehydrogenase family protein, partial [Myxococcota bacterium]|nr:acyl-CoA dehydrogenase family protein [Myxococcota bacterium]
ERCPIEEVRRLAGDPLGHDPGVWKAMAELGWTGLTIPEAHGGAGLGNLHQALLLEEMGRRLLPSPYLGGALAALALARAGDDAQQARWLPGIASGERVATLGWLEPEGSWEPGDVAATARRDGDGYRLSGAKAHALAGEHAELLVAPFAVDGEVALFALEGGWDARAEVSVDPTRRTARLRFDDVAVPAEARLAHGDLATWRATLLQGAAWLAAEMVGTAEGILAMTRDYAVDRKQFGRQIGSFQAVKHPLVDDMIGIELARSLAYGAAAAWDAAPEGDADTEETSRMAKALVSDVLARAVRHGVQFHGGYGFTIDCDVHFYFKRALFCRAMLGDALHHRRHLATALFADAG